MPHHYYQYYCALQQFQPGKINPRRGHSAPDPDGGDGDSSGGGDASGGGDDSDCNEDSDDADELRKKPAPKKAKAGTFIFDGVDATILLVQHPHDWYGVGTETAIQSLNFLIEYSKKHILVEMNREMQSAIPLEESA